MSRTLVMAASLWSIALALFLLTSGFLKLNDLNEFSRTLTLHGLVPAAQAPSVAGVVAAAEALCAILVLTWTLSPRTQSRAALTLCGVMLVFVGYALILWFRPPPAPAPCGCGLTNRVVESWAIVAFRNTALLGATLAAHRILRAMKPNAIRNPPMTSWAEPR